MEEALVEKLCTALPNGRWRGRQKAVILNVNLEFKEKADVGKCLGERDEQFDSS